MRVSSLGHPGLHSFQFLLFLLFITGGLLSSQPVFPSLHPLAPCHPSIHLQFFHTCHQFHSEHTPHSIFFSGIQPHALHPFIYPLHPSNSPSVFPASLCSFLPVPTPQQHPLHLFFTKPCHVSRHGPQHPSVLPSTCPYSHLHSITPFPPFPENFSISYIHHLSIHPSSREEWKDYHCPTALCFCHHGQWLWPNMDESAGRIS